MITLSVYTLAVVPLVVVALVVGAVALSTRSARRVDAAVAKRRHAAQTRLDEANRASADLVPAASLFTQAARDAARMTEPLHAEARAQPWDRRTA